MEFLLWIVAAGVLFLSAGVASKVCLKPEDADGIYPACFGSGAMLLYVAFLVCGAAALARDSGQWDSGDQEIRAWYQSLMQPDVPTASCCGEADAYFADEVHVRDGKTFAVITDDRPDGPRHRPHIDNGTEFEVPDTKLKWDRGNPTGHGVIFLSRQGFVFCYVQPGGA